MMASKLLSLWLCSLILFTYIVLLHCGQISRRFTLRRDGYRLNNATITEEMTCQSLIICTTYCNQFSWCYTISFNLNEYRCLLSSQRVTHYKNVASYLVTQSNWVTMTKPFYTVFQRQHSAGRYKATYADAITMCSELSTVVASETDLLASRSLGLEMCACGWLSNQRNGFILQAPNWHCWGKYNTYVLYCNYGKANVWCRL